MVKNKVDKEFRRILNTLHGEDIYDPIVSEARKDWWFKNALNYTAIYVQVYLKFDSECEDLTGYW